VCDTCDFVFPGGIHLCPTCATDTTVRLSSSRKLLVGWSLGAAVWVTGVISLLMVGVFEEFVQTPEGDLIIGAAMQLPALIGFGLAIGSLDGRAGNPPVVWVTVIWNTLAFAAFVLLLVLGLMATLGGM
jgi:hypothetical protein